jgi:hypothetical protein
MLRAISLVVLVVAALAAHVPRAAAGTVGVVVTGELSLQQPLVAQLEGWLRSHGYQVAALALDPAATTRLLDCLTVDDSTCARGVVEAKSRSDSVVFARATRERSTTTLTMYWIAKGRPPAGGRRGCEDCTDDAVRGAADELIASLAPAATGTTGRLKLSSKPEGMIVMLDGQKIGVTPIERDIAAGEHTIVLVDGGTRVGERKVQIPEGATIEVTMPVVYPPDNPKFRTPPEPSRVPPVLCWVGGGLLFGGSGVAFYLGQKGGLDHPNDKYIYRGATPTGVGLAAAGVAAIGIGVWLWVRGSGESSESSGAAPVAAIGPGGGYLGWQGRF